MQEAWSPSAHPAAATRGEYFVVKVRDALAVGRPLGYVPVGIVARLAVKDRHAAVRVVNVPFHDAGHAVNYFHECRDAPVRVLQVIQPLVEAGTRLAEVAAGGRVAVPEDGCVDVPGVPDVLLIQARRYGRFARGQALRSLSDLQALPADVVIILADRPVVAVFFRELADSPPEGVVTRFRVYETFPIGPTYEPP